MSKPRKWPKYLSPDPAHMHATGVLVYCFNSFEETIARITILRTKRSGGAVRRVRRIYHELSDSAKSEFTKLIFSTCETDLIVRKYAFDLINYFECCRFVRNDIVHSRFDPPLFKNDQKRLYLNKSKSKNASSIRYSKPTLRTLRNYADKMSVGLARAVSLQMFLLYRDKPANEIPLLMRQAVREPLPGIPPPPKRLRKSDRPHTPEMPPHLRRAQE
jgi:hypothetical protein